MRRRESSGLILPIFEVLNFAYLWRYNGVPGEKIAADISDWARGATRGKLRRYARRYPKSVREIIESELAAR